MYRTDFWTLWEKVRVGWSERIALKHVYYQVWNRLPVQVGYMRQVLRAGALGWPGGMGWGTHINPWLIHVNVWQKPLQYCKVISLQLIKINGKKKKDPHNSVNIFQMTNAWWYKSHACVRDPYKVQELLMDFKVSQHESLSARFQTVRNYYLLSFSIISNKNFYNIWQALKYSSLFLLHIFPS